MYETTDSTLEQVEEQVRQRDFVNLRKNLVLLEPAQIADLLSQLHREDQAGVFRLLPKEFAILTFEHLPSSHQEEMLKSLGDHVVAEILDEMAPDDRTALLEELPGKVTRRLLNLLSPEERKVATQLLGYPEESIGRLMTPDWVAVKPQWTVREALEHIRHFGRDSETLNTVYVVEKGGRLIDDIRMRELLLTHPDTRVEELMDNQFIALAANDDQETAVGVFKRYDRTALPVVDSDGSLVGIVTVDDVLDIRSEEHTSELQSRGHLVCRLLLENKTLQQ